MKTILTLSLIGLLLAACGGAATGPRALKAGEKPVVIASTLHLGCLAAIVGGDDAKVELLAKEGADPHGYDPTIEDRRRLESAHLLVVNGLNLETFDAGKIAAASAITLVDCSKDIPEKFLIEAAEDEHADHGHGHSHGHDHGHEAHDPHVWLSAEGAAYQAAAIAAALGKLDAAHAKGYSDRAEELKKRLFAIRDEFKPKLEKIANKKFATDHDAFAYFAREAGLGEASFLRKVPARSVSVDERRKLEQELKAAGARAIFVEPGHDSDAAKEVAASLKIKLATLDPFEMGKLEPKSFEENYRRNLQTVLDALGE
ncbi:MAG: zinc ABC transporter substrate-binding protein [Planctomycetes bacterium]|nr:zinc ABC transporter substrate-binding protein [Planctomycetota bacterium]